MRNLAKLFAAVTLASTFSFAQYVEYEDNEQWPTSEEQEAEEAAKKEAEQKAKAEAEKKAQEPEEDVVAKVLAQKRAADAARKEQEQQEAIRKQKEAEALAAKKASRSTAGIGFRADFNLAYFWGSKDLEDGVEEPSGYGFDIGFTTRFEMLDVLWFTPELHFEAYWLEQEEESFTRQFDQMNISLPLMFRAVLHPRVYFEAGPQGSVNISNKCTFDKDNSKLHVPGADDIVVNNSFDETEIEQTSFALGASMGLGFYIIPDYLSVSVRFYVGMTEIFPEAKSPLSEREDDRIMVGTKLSCVKFGLNGWIF